MILEARHCLSSLEMAMQLCLGCYRWQMLLRTCVECSLCDDCCKCMGELAYFL